MSRLTAVIAVTAGFVALASAPAAARATAQTRCSVPRFSPGADYRPTIHPDQFSAHVTNPFFPLYPGTTFVSAGTKDGKRAVDVFAVSRSRRVIDGVRTRVVNDRLYLNGVLEERTADYYSQDRCGNVWYFGEDTATLDRSGNVVDRSGSFHAGVHGAQPGVYMQACPQPGRLFRQEWSQGNAEDKFSAIGKNATIKVPYGTFHHALRTRETTALEPAVVDNKLYVRGIGQVAELAVKGPAEQLYLVDVLS